MGNAFTDTTNWLVVGPGAFGNSDAWQASPTSSGAVAEKSDNDAWISGTFFNVPAFDVLGTNVIPSQVPEPASVILLGTGFGAMLLMIRRRRL